MKETAGHGAVQGFSTINTISAKLVDANGNQHCQARGVTVRAYVAMRFVVQVSIWLAA